MDFKNFNSVWKLKRFCISCIEFIFKFCFSEFCFQSEVFFDFDFKMHKTHALFSRFCSWEIIVRHFISLMAKFVLYNVLASELELFENGIHFARAFDISLT